MERVAGDFGPVEDCALDRFAAKRAGDISLRDGKGKPGSGIDSRTKVASVALVSAGFGCTAAAATVVGCGGMFGKPALRASFRALCSAARRIFLEDIMVTPCFLVLRFDCADEHRVEKRWHTLLKSKDDSGRGRGVLVAVREILVKWFSVS